jgi:hypothetical protein
MAAIDSTLELVRSKLNDTLRRIDPRNDDWVILSNIVDQTGRPFEGAQNKVVLLLANMQEEPAAGGHPQRVPVETERVGAVHVPLYIDLSVLFYANFEQKNYVEGLRMISHTIAFFQQNPIFTHDNAPELDPSIDRLRFEFTSLDLTSLNSLLGNLGVKYLPSAYYKVGIIPFTSNVG